MMGIGWAEMLSVVFLFGGALGLPVGVPPAKEDPLLAKIAPAECLFYSSWTGVAAPDPKSKNHTEQLLAEAEVREFLADVERRITSALNTMAERERSPQARLLADLLPKWGKAVLTKPVALFVSDVKIGPRGPQISAGFMMNAGDDVDELKKLLERLEAEAVGTPVKTVTISGASFRQFQPAPDAPLITWGIKGKYIVAGLGEGTVEAMFERSTKEPPKWLTDVRKSLPVERFSSVAYADVKKIVALVAPFGGPQAQKAITAFGLGNVTSYSSVAGLDESGFVSRTLIRLEGEPQGLFTLASAKPLTAADLASIPHDAPAAVSFRLSGAALFDAVVKAVGAIEPRAVDELEAGLKGLEGGLAIKVREDILNSLGDVWQVYAAPNAGGLITGWTASVTIKDRAKLLAAHDKLVRLARGSFRPGPRSPQIKEFKFAGQDVFYFTVPDDDFLVTPAWCLTEDRLVVGAFPQAIKAHLSRTTQDKSLADAPEVAALLKGNQGPLMVSYLDPKEVLKLVYPLVQVGGQLASIEFRRNGVDLDVSALPSLAVLNKHLKPGVTVIRRSAAGVEFETRQTLPGGNVGATAPVTLALLLPAVQSAREAARRTQGSNNLKQIALALHNFHDVHRRFPAAYNTDMEGKPLLSWRVHILPYIEQAPLYDQFRFDEPWDSEHNKKLIEKMPPTYRSPSSKAEPGKTNYLGVRVKSGVIIPPADADKGKSPPLGVGIASILDGTSNTIMVVEAGDAKAVIWTKPDDVIPDDMSPVKALSGLLSGGFQAAFCDGSVRFISESIDPEVLKLLFSRDDGKPVPFR